MKVLLIVALCVACAHAGKLQDIGQKLMPSFATGHIIEGEDAEPHSAPYIVSLSGNRQGHSHGCGGSIIAPQWVVTAGHCVSTAKGMSVIAGLHKVKTFDARTQQRFVDYGKVHEDFAGGVGPNDIALLHVSEPFKFNDWIQPVVLPKINAIPEGEAHLYGWGQPKPFQFSPASTLQTVATDVVEHSACKAILPPDAPLADTNLCTDSHQKHISACNGDSGGPLVIEHADGRAELIGIVSWGYLPCGSANLPSVFTRVSAFLEWIGSIRTAYDVLY